MKNFYWLIDGENMQPIEVCDGKVYFIGSEAAMPLSSIESKMIRMKEPCPVCFEVGGHLLGCIMR